VVIDVGEMAASAAYWLASVGHEIRVGRFSELGSIGAYVIVPDSSKMYEDFGMKINVVASGKDKGTGIEGTEVTPEQLEPEQERIDQIAAMFLADVQAYRNVDDSVMSGRTWIGGVAVNMGLADTVSGTNRRSIAMPENEVAAEVTAAEEENDEKDEKQAEISEEEKEEEEEGSEEDLVKAERTRCAEIAATFAHSPEFASLQIESGATLNMAKAAWFDYCKDHPENKPVAAKPSRIVAANQSPQPVAGNWTDALRACAAANNVSLSEAGRILSETNPELYRKNFE
jgi:ClpP class serine protease